MALVDSSLVSLDLDSCSLVSAAGLSNLRGLPLTALSLAWTDVNDSGLSALHGLPLERLNLAFCNYITPAGIAALRGITSLRDLDVHSCRGLGDAFLEALVGLPVVKLEVSSNPVTDEGLISLGELSGLTDLGLSGIAKISVNGMKALKKLPLTRLAFGLDNATGGHVDFQVGDKHLSELRGLPLTDLDLGFRGFITDAGISALVGMPLTKLNVSFCPSITDVGLATLQLSGIKLETVHQQ